MNRSENMSRIRSKDTKPELIVRRLLHSLGYRYRLHRKDLPGKPDIVFPSRRKAIFVHGCFWHAHGCKVSHQPKSNEGYWSPKLQRNMDRDRTNRAVFENLGWSTLVVWECQLSDRSALQGSLQQFLNGSPDSAPA